MKIAYLNAPAGSGKTHCAILKYALPMFCTGQRVIVAMPTMRLIKEASKYLRRLGIPFEIIVGDADEDRTVGSRLVEKLKKPSMGGELVFSTHAGLKMLPYAGEGWNLIIDEAPQIDKSFDPIIDDDVRLLVDTGEFYPSGHDGLKLFRLSKNPTTVLSFPSQFKDRTQVHALAWAAHSKHTTVYVPDASIESLSAEPGGDKKFLAFAITDPSLVERFESVLILSANFRDSLLFQLWSKQGVRFVENTELAKSLRFRQHDGSRATISYLMDHDWSRKNGELEIDGVPLHSKIVQKASDHFGDDRFLWVANKRYSDDIFAAMNRAGFAGGSKP